MNTITNASIPLKIIGVVLAIALVAVAALVVPPTQAQSTDDMPTSATAFLLPLSAGAQDVRGAPGYVDLVMLYEYGGG